ncbi:MAG: hypothetical protein LBJ12_09780 [Oscillospiraceae bacterium]|nr:hypothetical protein [Oscillospiraceae bacterium]
MQKLTKIRYALDKFLIFAIMVSAMKEQFQIQEKRKRANVAQIAHDHPLETAIAAVFASTILGISLADREEARETGTECIAYTIVDPVAEYNVAVDANRNHQGDVLVNVASGFACLALIGVIGADAVKRFKKRWNERRWK